MKKAGKMMEYTVDDKELDAAAFIQFANRIWPGNYDENKTRAALSKTINIAAYDKKKLAGCLRILSDGCFFGTITELLVLPEYRRQRIATVLTNRLAKEILQRGKVPFYCAAWSNIKSVRNAIRSGFRPGWVEMTAKKIEYVQDMIESS